MVCAPMRSDLEVLFTEWAFTEADADLHEDPPVA